MTNINIPVTEISERVTPMEVAPYITQAKQATPSDTVDTPQIFKVVCLGTGGTPGVIKWLNLQGEEQEFPLVIPGQLVWIHGKRILSTGTTATPIYWGGGN